MYKFLTAKGASTFLALMLTGMPLAEAGWYRDIFPKENADLYMIDILYPHFDESTYFACWNINFFPSGGYFYGGCAGYTGNLTDKTSFSPHSVWTFWEHPSYETKQARNVYVNPLVYTSQYGGEGASGFASAPVLSWVKVGQWYTAALRVFGTDPEKKQAYVGQWHKDQKNNEWHHVGTFLIPAPITGIASNSEFIEGTGGGQKPREVWRSKSFLRYGKDNWEKANKIEVDVPVDNGTNYYGWIITQPEDKSHITLAYTGDRQYETTHKTGQKYLFEINQPDKPALDSLDATATSALAGQNLTVTWTLGKHSSPQLGYKVEVFNNEACEGTPLIATEELIPHRRTASLTLPKSDQNAQAPYYVKLTLVDIFDQTKSLTPTQIDKPQIAKAQSVSSLEGLEYAYIEKEGGWDSLKEIDFSTPLRQGIAHGLDLSLRGTRDGGFAFQFKGFIKVPQTGAYTFALRSCDGAKLTIDSQDIIDNDGLHSTSEVDASCFLQKGLVPITLTFFKKNPSSHTDLWLGWSTAGKSLESIPLTQFAYNATTKVPQAQIIAKTQGASALLGVKTDAQDIKSIDYYNDGQHIGKSTTKPFTFNAPLYQGNNKFLARITYQNNKTIDSAPFALVGKNSLPEGWTSSILGEKTLAHGIQYNKGTYDFVGEGEYLIHQPEPITGDFEVTAYVNKVQTEGISGRAWAGIMAKPHLAADNNELGIYVTANSRVRSSPDYSDLATTRVAAKEFPYDYKYLKLTRHGALIRAYCSKDGKDWKLALQRYDKSIPEKLYVGLNFHAVPGKSKAIFNAQVQDFKISAYKPVKDAISPLVKLGNVLGYTLLKDGQALKQYRKDTSLVTPQADGTYKETKLNLPKDILNVRSATTDGNTLLILARTAPDKAAVYRSEDNGHTWTKTLDKLNLDPLIENNVSPLIAFNPTTPGACVVGSYKTGLFYSSDSGKTWADPVLIGEVITALAYHIVHKDLVYLGTFNETTQEGTLYGIENAGKDLNKRNTSPYTYILNFLFNKRDPGPANLLTKNGYIHSYNGGHSYFHMVNEPDHHKAYIACDTQNLNGMSNFWTASLDGKELAYSFNYYSFGWNSVAQNLPDWGNVFALIEDNQNREQVTIFAEKGIFQTKDKAQTWKKID